MTQAQTNRTSVIIPNWNGAQHLVVCIESLLQQSWPKVEIIVVDNASSDDSLDILTRYPSVQVIALPENKGFTGACNTGFRAASGDVQILLNNDTEVDVQWIEKMMTAFEAYPDVGIVASKMLLFDQRDTLHTAGDYVSLDGLAHNRGVWQKDEGQYDHPAYVFSACGGSSAYRTTMLEQIGLLDDNFFFSFEDVDLAWRAELSGWRCLYVPDAIVYHKLKATGGGTTASYYDGRNRIRTLVKNYPPDLWRAYWRKVIGAELGLAWEAIKLWRGKAARATLRGMLNGLFSIPSLLRQRREIQQQRTVERAWLERLMQDPYEISLED